MTAYIRIFSSVSELLSSLDDDIAESKKYLGELLRIIEALRVRAENEKALTNLLSKLGVNIGKKQSTVINLKNLKIIVNPSTEEELTALEMLAEYISRRIKTLQDIKKELESFASINVEARFEAVYIDGVLKEVYIKY
jgi:hypothetical protein